ncbi:MAG: hypothetical protein ACRCXN_08400 [Bacteroidales bacterium]
MANQEQVDSFNKEQRELYGEQVKKVKLLAGYIAHILGCRIISKISYITDSPPILRYVFCEGISIATAEPEGLIIEIKGHIKIVLPLLEAYADRFLV